MGKSPPLCSIKSIKLRTRRLLEAVPSQDYMIWSLHDIWIFCSLGKPKGGGGVVCTRETRSNSNLSDFQKPSQILRICLCDRWKAQIKPAWVKRDIYWFLEYKDVLASGMVVSRGSDNVTILFLVSPNYVIQTDVYLVMTNQPPAPPGHLLSSAAPMEGESSFPICLNETPRVSLGLPACSLVHPWTSLRGLDLNPASTFTIEVLVSQSCPTPCDAMDCKPQDFSVHGILQARIHQGVMNIGVHVSLSDLVSLVCMPRSGIELLIWRLSSDVSSSRK